MITEPKLEKRDPQPYAAVRAQVPIPFGRLLPPLWQESRDWLASKGVSLAGPPLIRYLTTDMAKKLDIEVGWPAATEVPGDGRVVTGVLPAGRYAVLTYTGSYRGKGLMKATAALLGWADENHIAWQKSARDDAEWWGARLEYYLTDIAQQPDPKKWQAELAFLTVDGMAAPSVTNQPGGSV